MLRSFYIAGTGMLTQRAKMDVVINNLTNSDTVGYKKDQVVTRSFGDMLISRLNDKTSNGTTTTNNNAYVGPLNTGTYIDRVATDFTSGPMQITNLPTDLAIAGNGFFTVQTPQGTRYTRSGNFQVDLNGNLLTQEGYYVTGQNGGMINVGTQGNFKVSSDGTVTVNNQNVGRLQIVQFENNNVLRKEGGNLFNVEGGAPQVMNNPSIVQGALEGSNLDLAREMADMLTTNRVYESNQRILKMVDESLAKTVSEIGRF